MAYRKRKDEVWEKADTIPGKDPDQYRLDKTGNVIYYDSYGKDTPMGWNIDHAKPQKLGGTDHLNNLQVLQTSQNKSKGAKPRYDYANVETRGVERYDLIETDIDKRSALVQNEELLFNYDGTIDRRSKAVRSGAVKLNSDGSARANSKAFNDGSLRLK